MSIFSQSLSLFISPLILNYGGTNWGRVWGTGRKSFVIFFLLVRNSHIWNCSYFCFATVRPDLCFDGVDETIFVGLAIAFEKKVAKCVLTVLVALSVFGSVFGPETNAIN